MDKFYVQCGPVEVVLLAEDAGSAAVAGIQRKLDAHLWIYDEPTLSDNDRRDHLMVEALLHLSPSIRVSRRGFDSDQFERFGTPETVLSYHRLMTGMRELFAAAGVPAATMQDVAGVKPVGVPTRRRAK